MSDITSSETNTCLQWTVVNQQGDVENAEDGSHMRSVNTDDAYFNTNDDSSSNHQPAAAAFVVSSPELTTSTGNADEHDTESDCLHLAEHGGSQEQLEETSSGSSFEILSVPEECGGSGGDIDELEKMTQASAVVSVDALASSGTAEHFEASSGSDFELLPDENGSSAESETALHLPFEDRSNNDDSSHQCYRQERTTKYIMDMNLQMASDLIRQSDDAQKMTSQTSEDEQPSRVESSQLQLSREGSIDEEAGGDSTRKDDEQITNLDLSLPFCGAIFWGFVLLAGMALIVLGMLIHASSTHRDLELYRNRYNTCLIEKQKLKSMRDATALHLHSQHPRNICSSPNFGEQIMLLQVKRLEQRTEKLELAYKNSQHEMLHQMEKVVELKHVIERLKDENQWLESYLQHEHGHNYMPGQEGKVAGEPQHDADDLKIQNRDADLLLPLENIDQDELHAGSSAERTFSDESSSMNRTMPSQTLTNDFVSLVEIMRKLYESTTLKVNLSDHRERADELKRYTVFLTFLQSLLEANANTTSLDYGDRSDVFLTALHKIDLCLNVLQNLTSRSLYDVLSLNWHQVREIISSDAFISKETKSGFDETTNRTALEPCYTFMDFTESTEIKEQEPLRAFINKTVEAIGKTVSSALDTIKTLSDKFLSERKTEPKSSSTFGQKFKDTIKNVNSRFSRGYEKLKEKFNKKFKSSLGKFSEKVQANWKKLDKQVSTTRAWFDEAKDRNKNSDEIRNMTNEEDRKIEAEENINMKDEESSNVKAKKNRNRKDEKNSNIKAEENKNMKVKVKKPLKEKKISLKAKEKLKYGIKSVENKGTEVINESKSESKLDEPLDAIHGSTESKTVPEKRDEMTSKSEGKTKKKKVPTATLR